jgi:hypothetical protein
VNCLLFPLRDVQVITTIWQCKGFCYKNNKIVFVDNLAALVGSLWIDCGQWQLTGGAIAGLIVDNVDNTI